MSPVSALSKLPESGFRAPASQTPVSQAPVPQTPVSRAGGGVRSGRPEEDSFLRKVPRHFHRLLPPSLARPPRPNTVQNRHLDPQSLRALRPTKARRSSFIASHYGHTLASLTQRVMDMPQVETSLKRRMHALLQHQKTLTDEFYTQRLADIPC